jgi:hypothetical protein
MTVPAGVQTGDLLLAFYSYWTYATASAPSGWQMLQSSTSTGSGVETVWYRFATSSDTPGTSYGWSFSGDTPYEAGGMLDYRGVAPAVEDGSCTNSGKSTAPSWCSFTTAYSNDMYVGFIATENTNLILPADLTGRVVTQYLNGSYFGVAAADKSLGSAGAVPADVGSMNSGGWETVAIALKPLNSGPTPTATATVATATATVSATVMPTVPAPTPTSTVVATQTATTTPTATSTPSSIIFVGSTNTTSTTMTVPAGVQTGDLLLAFYSYWTYATANAPSGWQTLQSATSTGSGVETVWYRFATSSDVPGSTYSWSFSGDTPYEAGGMLDYRGVAPGVEDGSCTNSGSSTAPSWCSFTTTYSNDMYVGFIATENTNLILPSDLTGLVLDQYLNGAYFGVAAADKSLGAAGTVPADVGSMNSGGWATVAIALKPLNSGSTPNPTATATPTPSAITFIGSSSTTSTTMTVPSGVQSGDLLLAFYSYWTYATANAPSGWQMLQSSTSTGSGVETVWYRFATSSDTPGTTYGWSFSGDTPYEAGGMLDYRGVAPAVEDGSCTNSGKSTAPGWCSFTTSYSNDMYVAFVATENTNLVLPGDLTGLVVDQYLNGSYFGVAAADKSLGSAGTVPADVGSMNSGGWATVAIALKAQ